MNEQTNSDTPTPMTEGAIAPLPEIKPEATASAAAMVDAERLLSAIRGDAATVLSTRDEVMNAKAAADEQLAAIKVTVTAITQQVESAKSVVSAASEIIGRIEAIRDDAIKSQATIAERNGFIQGGLEHVAQVQRELDVVLDSAKRSANQVDAQQQASKATADNMTAIHAAVLATKEKVDSDAGIVGNTRAGVEGHAVATKRLVDLAEATEKRVRDYEAKFTAMQQAACEQQTLIDSILAGATNASLGGAYDKRSKTFKSPVMFWQCMFFVAIAGLLVFAFREVWFIEVLVKAPNWEELARMLLHRVPIIGPLIWLAIYAARQASFAKRMEEEYAFKATTSMSFEGYRRQMAEVGNGLTADSPLAQLCNSTIRTIAAPPGNVYNKQRMDPTPGTALAEFIDRDRGGEGT